MPPRRNTRQREARLAFEALSIEGSLLSAEWLAKVAQLGAEQQADTDYRIPKGLNLRDEIGRYWRIAQAHWNELQAGLKSNGDRPSLAERFVVALLRDAFGFASLATAEPVVIAERSYPLGHRALSGRVPVVIAPAGSGLDTLAQSFGEDSRRRSAFGLAQELLNADDKSLWGLATDGATLRVLRDNASLTRPAWIEADLARIFAEERYADFAALWLLIHETRFGGADSAVTDCPLEIWRTAGREEGTRAREHLRRGVEDALVSLGQGFLSHPENQDLRASLHEGKLTKDAYFQQLLRLVYRLIFLITAEERGVLHAPSADGVAKARYAAGYGLRRLRERAVKRSAHDRFADLWEGTKIALRGVAKGESLLGLPALGGLFAEDQCPALDAAKLENRALMAAVFKLSWLREPTGLSRVNWRDMGPEELGSVYESLLELVPQISEGGRGFSFASGSETKGNARKKTGSYYTPDSLVQVLLDSALEPVVRARIAASPQNPVEALLSLAIVDPACGSGHFLLAAARRLAAHVARVEAKGTPSAAEYRHAVRQVVGRCLFGVDLNPMAVELCRVSLWMEAVEPGRPLSFLDSHIQQGNSLLGTTPALLANGIPDAAWEPIEGDDSRTASLLKRRNNAAAAGQRGFETLWSDSAATETAEVARGVAELDAAPDANLAEIVGKEARWDGLRASPAFQHQKFIADAWCSAFVWPKPPTEPSMPAPLVDAAPTNELWRQLRDGQGKVPPLTVATVRELTGQYSFLHWHLAFPQIFARGGFDVVLGNPPWEKINFKDEEYFADLNPEIANASNKAERKKLLAKLEKNEPEAFRRYEASKRINDGSSSFFRHSGYFPRTGVSRINLYSVFCETGVRIVAPRGRLGMVLSSGIVTDDNNKDLFAELINSGRLVHAWDFENREALFRDVDSRFKFCLFAATGDAIRIASADFAFFLSTVGELAESDRHFTLSGDELRLLNPLSLTCPTFRNKHEAAITKEIYRTIPAWALHTKLATWPGTPKTPFNMSNDSNIFVPTFSAPASVNDGELRPLYESKFVHQFNHRFAGFTDASSETAVEFSFEQLADPSKSVCSRYSLPAATLRERFPGDWFVAYRKIARATDERTAIAALLPEVACGDSLILIEDLDADGALMMTAMMNSFIYDYCARQKVAGTNFNHWIWHQLPVPTSEQLHAPATWAPDSSVLDWVRPRALELSFSAWDLAKLAHDVGYDGPPFRWDVDRRLLLRCELDAAFFHLYGVSREDAAYVLDTFPIVRKNDEKAHGEYRTKRLILEIYDELAAAIRTGAPYRTRLDPPPADAHLAHAATSRPNASKSERGVIATKPSGPASKRRRRSPAAR